MQSIFPIKVGWLSGLRRYPDSQADAGSNPGWVFSFFLQFSQTLRANSHFQGTIGNKQPFLSKSRGSGIPLHTVKTHAPLSPLYENCS